MDKLFTKMPLAVKNSEGIYLPRGKAIVRMEDVSALVPVSHSYGEIDKAMRCVLDDLDHRHLNDVEGLTTTTTETICVWIWQRIKASLPLLSRVSVSETPKTWAHYCGDEQ